MKDLKEFTALLKEIIASKKKNENTYDYIDYESDDVRRLVHDMKPLIDHLTDLGEGLN